jgi:transcriptional regulator with XRE-family HTH domain
MIKATSNADFARLVGVHFTMASRLRNGHRIPSPQTMLAIRDAFKLTPQEVNEMVDACSSQEQFGSWCRWRLFEEPADLLAPK